MELDGWIIVSSSSWLSVLLVDSKSFSGGFSGKSLSIIFMRNKSDAMRAAKASIGVYRFVFCKELGTKL